jgi:hypothetical protein
MYNPLFIKRFNAFKKTQNVNESLKIATWNRIESI